MNVLVTGATGYLGAEVVRAVLGNRHTVIALVRDLEKATLLCDWCVEAQDRLRILAGDIRTLQHLPTDVDTLIHAAALRGPGECELRCTEAIETNIQGTLNLLRLSTCHGVKRFVYLSSQSVYGDQSPPWHEDALPNPRGVYALTKYAGEKLVHCFGDTLDWSVLRLSRLYGTSLFVRWSEIIGKFVQMAYNGQRIPVHGDGTQRFDFVHVADAARCVVHLLDVHPEGWNETYNIGGGRSVSLNELLETLTQLARESNWATVSVEQHPEIPPSWPRHLELDITRARTQLGWAPRHSLREGLAEYLTTCPRL